MRLTAPSRAAAAALLVALAACSGDTSKPKVTGITGQNHTFFPIGEGTKHALVTVTSCDSCHPPSAASFKDVSCIGCHVSRVHDQQISDLLHKEETGYTFGPKTCLTCHPMGEHFDFTHKKIVSSECATCHDVGAPFARLPVAGHPAIGTSGCGGCHNTTAWKPASGAPNDAHDPARDVSVTALIPTWSSTSIISLTPDLQTLPQQMNHDSLQLPMAAREAACSTCHADADQGFYYPGVLHDSLAAMQLSPTGCSDCHAFTQPTGFVGATATNPVRSPPSGEMKHDAVAWVGGAPVTTMTLVPADCGLCHVSPTGPSTWSSGKASARARFHASLAPQDQPGSCIDCHANSRPTMLVSLTGGTTFDHQHVDALGECRTCHANAAALAGTSWANGKFHLAGASTPATCVPCHDGERPTSTTGWVSTTYTARPFDYTVNARGNTHGDAQDCVSCHNGPGTGAWGSTQNWVGGDFRHGPTTVSAVRCVSCHTTQRPAVPVGPVPQFDHARDGTGDCFACHQATVVANRYQALGDWDGGIAYPATFVSSTDLFVNVSLTTLNRSGAANLVTSMTTANVPLYEGMLHISTAIPVAMRPGPAGNPDYQKCQYCHTAGQYRNGLFHDAVTDAGFPQPMNQCNDCHASMLPPGIVEKSASVLQPMDHRAKFVGADAGVAELDCSTCHRMLPGATWADGTFHSTLGGQQPRECVSCHYPLMASATMSDLTLMTRYRMQHRSGQLTFQACESCHTGALGMAQQTPLATRWSPGAYHPSLTAQPATCVDCHQITVPAANSPTQSTVQYTLPAGGTATNSAQWMNHGSSLVVGKDCAVCHLADAKTAGSAWSKADLFHPAVANAATCRECHGLTNGGGSVPGTNNNMPTGLTSSTTVTTASAATGVPAGTFDQISHADINVTAKDCKLCHTQQGASTVAGIQGKEWTIAKFHLNFTGANGLVLDGVGGRCSNCHLNVKPRPGFSGFNHDPFTAMPGSEDCKSCHAWPGLGTPTAPNWRGAAGAPATVTLAPWVSGTSITSKSVTFAHPPPTSYTSCEQCHAGVNYSKLTDYNHAGLTSNVLIDGVAPSPTPNLGNTVYNAATNATFCVHCHNTGSPYIASSGTSSLVASTTAGSTTVTTGSTAALVVGMTVTGTPIPTSTSTTTMLVGNTTAGSVTVTTGTPVSLSRGTVISGPGIPLNDTVAVSVTNALAFTLTAPPTATATVTLTAVRTTALTVTVRTIPNGTSFTISTAANATATGATLSVSHRRPEQQRIGSHENSVNGQDCTSCHASNGTENLTPPTPGVFTTGKF